MPRAGLALAFALWGIAADAQVSGSATVASDYRFRGISLTGNRPVVQATVDYDAPTGIYAGAFASNVRLDDRHGGTAQLLGFAGYSLKLGEGPDLDVGASASAFPAQRIYDYAEVHVGIAYSGIAARASYAPHYFGQPGATWYFEASGSRPLRESANAFVRAGLLRQESTGYYDSRTPRTIVDAGAGVSFDLSGFTATLAWSGVSTLQYPYPVAGAKRRNAVVVSVTRRF
ncbi:MAG TPA: TorF family putative porin [Casimicrobiaceae bacterium]